MNGINSKEPIAWTTEEVGIWLQTINFPEYKRLFIENFISGYELLDLSEEDLIMMGISILGHRKRILKALSKVAGNNNGDFDTKSTGSAESDSSDASSHSKSSVSSRSSISSTNSSKSRGKSQQGDQQQEIVYSAKCKYKNDVRMIEFKSTDSIRKLKSKIRKVYGRRLEVKINDKDGDAINVKTDRDLKTIIESFSPPYRFELSRRKRKTKEDTDALPEAETKILETLMGACVIMGDDCYIKYFNPAAEKLFGYHRDEVIGKNCNILMPPTYSSLHDQFINNYLKTGRSKIINSSRMVVGKHKSGADLSLEISLTETKTPTRHTFTAIFKYFEENSNNDNSKSAKEQFKTLEVLIDPVIVINESAQIVFANAAALRFFQYSEDELIYQNVNLLMPSPHKENHNHYLQNYLSTGKTTIIGKNRSLICELSDGTIKPINLSVSENINPITKKRNFIGVFREKESFSNSAVQSRPKTYLQQEREVVNGLFVASVIIDQNGVIQAFNKTAQQIFGYDLAEVLGQNVKMIVGEEEHQRNHDQYIQSYLLTKQAKIIGSERVVQCKQSNDQIFSAKLSVVAKVDPNSNATFFTGMFHKI